MTTKTLLGSQVKRLLSNLSDSGSQHLTEIETDLAQTDILLGEAIEKLGASFMAIHQAAAAQQVAVELLLSGAEPSAELIESLRTSRDAIDRHVNAAVTGLQFQDMTSQLLGRAVRRATGLRDVLDGVGAGSAGIPAESDAEEVSARLDGICKGVEDQSAQLDSALWRAVHQTHMESGDIELF